RLQEQESGVLMGTDTFWEGVDLPGNQMSLLIIVRLPFRSPADPFYQAWLEEMPSGKVFADLMIPEAVLKMKQGMGRLIRSEHDRGNIVILDRRMLPPPQGKGYANQFISSLPMGKPQLVNLEQLLRSVVD
ncbi:MAG: helicase C-terminal domain-containing protein, partial [Methylocystaceae bacterium]